jgi:phosphoribosylanthranilate isomerase
METGLKIKVCGMREPENIMAVASLRPDYMGFIFYPPSPRYVGTNFSLPVDFPKGILKVGVFVNAETIEMTREVKRNSLDFLQLHGDESPAQVAELYNSGIKIIKVFSVDEQFDFSKLIPYEPYVDFFLFDTKGRFYGGNAMAFDWGILKNYDQGKPFFLSGGLSPGNAEKVASLPAFNIHALDINSGVELKPGLKDPARVRQIQRIVAKIEDRQN